MQCDRFLLRMTRSTKNMQLNRLRIDAKAIMHLLLVPKSRASLVRSPKAKSPWVRSAAVSDGNATINLDVITEIRDNKQRRESTVGSMLIL